MREKCLFCNLDEVEDEYLFILVCQLCNNLRKTYLKKYFKCIQAHKTSK